MSERKTENSQPIFSSDKEVEIGYDEPKKTDHFFQNNFDKGSSIAEKSDLSNYPPLDQGKESAQTITTPPSSFIDEAEQLNQKLILKNRLDLDNLRLKDLESKIDTISMKNEQIANILETFS